MAKRLVCCHDRWLITGRMGQGCKETFKIECFIWFSLFTQVISHYIPEHQFPSLFMFLAALPDLPGVRPMSWRRADLLIIEMMREHNIIMQITWDG